MPKTGQQLRNEGLMIDASWKRVNEDWSEKKKIKLGKLHTGSEIYLFPVENRIALFDLQYGWRVLDRGELRIQCTECGHDIYDDEMHFHRWTPEP